MRTAPTLPAYETGLSLVVWCEHCRCWHWHGAGEGHRGAHCYKPGSPYERTGYNLRAVGPATADILKDMSRKKERGPKRVQAREGGP